MSEARKCDRCHGFYDIAEEQQDRDTSYEFKGDYINLHLWVARNGIRKDVTSQWYDLCPKCMTELECWLNNNEFPTICEPDIANTDCADCSNGATEKELELPSKLNDAQLKSEIKPSTKRQEMWENILSASQDPPVDIKVAKQDIKAFLKELQDHIPKARWNGSDCLVTEYTNPYWFNHDYIYFALFRYNDKGNLRISYDEIKHSWINKPVIEYIAPMRWGLFKKGRLAVKVTYENYKGFYDACERELGKKPATIYCGDFTVSICKKDGKFEIFDIKDQDKKIVNWEDVK